MPDRWLDRRIRELARGRVLDVGCGEGRYLPPGGIGVDLDLERLPRSARVVCGDALALPFAPRSFDSALAIRMLNDTGDVDGALAEVRRVLRPGGVLVVYTRARAAPGDRFVSENGAERLARLFESVSLERDPEHERGALFVAA